MTIRLIDTYFSRAAGDPIKGKIDWFFKPALEKDDDEYDASSNEEDEAGWKPTDDGCYLVD
jgi:hypothetical protein